MKEYIPHLLLLLGILIFANGFLVLAYSGSLIAAVVPIIGVGIAVYGFLRLRNRSISN